MKASRDHLVRRQSIDVLKLNYLYIVETIS